MIDTSSFAQPIHAVIIGATGGIGRALVELLLQSESIESIHALSRSEASFDDRRVTTSHLDLTDEASIESTVKLVKKSVTPNLIIVATGLLHHEQMQPEKTYKHIEAESFAEQFAVNTTGVALVAKHFLPLMPRDERSIFAALSARVGSISDNRIGGWIAYRSAKAALNMTLKCLAVEMKRTHKQAIIAGLHPGTVDTPLSEPFQSAVSEKQLFTPDYSAKSLLSVINGLTADDSGLCFAWDGQQIDF